MTPRPATLCRHYREPESAHHAFETLLLSPPSGCQCDIETWRGVRIPDTCGKFEQARRGFPPRCANCEHDRECHEVKR